MSMRLFDVRIFRKSATMFALLVCALAGQAGTFRYVANSGSDANTGLSWAQAYATISNAVTNAVAGDTIMVSNGTYGVTNEIVVNKGVTIMGLGAPGDTIVERTGIQSNRIFTLLHPDILLANLTIQKGYIGIDSGQSGGGGSLSGGGGIFMTGGIVSNCVIMANTNNTGTNNLGQNTGYPYGGGVAMSGGTLWGCTVSSNAAFGYGSFGQGVYMMGGMIRDSLVIGNYGRTNGYDQKAGAGICIFTNGIVTNTDVIANGKASSGASQVGGIYYSAGTVVDCRIVSNASVGVKVLNGRVLKNCRIGYTVSTAWTCSDLDMEGGTATNCTIYSGSSVPGIFFGVNANLVSDSVVSNEATGAFSFAGGVKSNQFLNGTVYNSAVSLGNAAAANLNQARVSGPSAAWNLAGKALTVGFLTSTGNVMLVTETGTVANAGSLSVIGVRNSLVVSNGATLNGTNAVLGSAGSYSNWLNLDNASATVMGLTLGVSSSSNSVSLQNNSVWNLNNGLLTLGTGRATNNTLFVDSSSYMTNAGGLSVNEAGRTVTLADGSLDGMNIQFSGGGLIAGSAAGLAPVSVTLSNYTLNAGGITNGGPSGIGLGGSNNTISILQGSLWNGGNQTLTIGNGATGNLLRIDGQGVAGGAIVTNMNGITVGQASAGNTLIVTNGGRLFSMNSVTIATASIASSNNLVLIAGGGPGGASAKWDLGNAAVLYLSGTGGTTPAAYNQLVVDGGGVTGGAELSNLVELQMGSGVSQTSNRVVIRNGGLLSAASANIGVQVSTNHSISVIGGGAATSRLAIATSLYVKNTCSLLVDGLGVDGSAVAMAGGTLVVQNTGSITVTNQGWMYLAAMQMYAGVSNSLAISTGGKVYSTGAALVGSAAGGKGHAVLVRDAGSLWDLGNQNLTVGIATSTNNTLTIDQGGSVDRVGTLTLAGSLNALSLRGGTLGAAATTYTNGQFVAGDGAQEATLKALGGALTFPFGLVISSNAVLSGVGTVSGTGAGVVISNGGAVNPGVNGAGPLTVGGSNLTWNGGAIYSCEITNVNLTPGWGWDLLNVSSQLVFAGGSPNVVIRMDTKGTNAAGFNPDLNYTLKILTYGSMTGYDTNLITLDTNTFLPSGYNWTLLNTNNAIWLVYQGTNTAGGASLVWNVPSNGNWSVAGNWAGGEAPLAGGDPTNVLRFGDNGTPYNSSNNLTGSFVLNRLVLANVLGTTNVICGNPLAFTNNGAAEPVVEYQSGGGAFVISNALSLTVGTTFGGEGGGMLVLASNVTGGQPLLKQGPWTLALASSNQFAEPVVITNGGVIRMDHNNAFGTNSVMVTNSGILLHTAAITFGNGRYREARVTGSGSLWTNTGALTIGSNVAFTVENGARLAAVGGVYLNGYGTSPLLIANGAQVFYGGPVSYTYFSVGANSSSNSALVTGAGTLVVGPVANNDTCTLNVGAGSTVSNTLTVENGGAVTNLRLTVTGTNRLVVSNSGRVYPNALTANGAGSSVMVLGGGGVTSVVSALSGSLLLGGVSTMGIVDGAGVDGSAVMTIPTTLGNGITTYGNTLVVTNKGRLISIGDSSTRAIGSTSPSNTLLVTKGGYARYAAGSGYFGVGYGAGGNYNSMIVQGTNSVLDLFNNSYRWEIGFGGSSSGNKIHVKDGALLTNSAVISVASFSTAVSCFNNGVLVTSTGQVYSSAGCEVGLIAGVTGNYVKVTDAGSYWSMGGQSITIGNINGWSTNNFLMITQDGIMDNIGNLVIRSNNLLCLYGGTLGLSKAGVTNGLVTTVGDGTQAATLKALNGGTLSFVSGLVVTNNGTLTGSGTILATTTVYGAVSPGVAIGALTNNGDFTLVPGANTKIELGAYTTPGAGWDLLAVTNGALQVNGTLSVLLTGGFAPTNTQSFVIMTNQGPLSVSGSFASGSQVPAYTNLGGKAVGYFHVTIGSQGVALDSFAPSKVNPGTVIFVR